MRSVVLMHPSTKISPQAARDELVQETSSICRAVFEVPKLSADPEERLPLARAFVAAVIASYWETSQCKGKPSWPIFELPKSIQLTELPAPLTKFAQSTGAGIASLHTIDAGYKIGTIYTGLLPADVRSRLGAFYTPPALCERLLDMAEEAGVDWASGKGTPRSKLTSIVSRLTGFELDPFSAWMSQVLLEVTLQQVCRAAKTRLAAIVQTCNSLEQISEGPSFDLVVGNPPYGRLTLSPLMRKQYERSLFGHANLYGVFTDLAMRLTKPGGVIAYVTPTSFLAGEYFKSLRDLLGKNAPPASMDFIAERRGVFEGVQQEALLATYKRSGIPGECKVHFISPSQDGWITTSATGHFQLPEDPREPWLIPRLRDHGALVQQMRKMPHRLSDYGYTVSTGPLVWNRHKPLLRDKAGNGRFPLIWAEAIRSDGRFHFRAEKKNHMPYFEPGSNEQWVVTNESCVLVQRTTAKEQSRRLVAAELPEEFIQQHGAVVIENHLNMIRRNGTSPKVTPKVLAALFNTDLMDQAFRCINGSVAVSAYELKALPLPCPEGMAEIEQLVACGASRDAINESLERQYGMAGT
jgi:adenine-specific DNA-methyltransferase